MNKRFGFLAMFLVLLLFVTACTNGTDTNTDVNNPGGNAGGNVPAAAASLSMDKLYNFANLNGYEYQMTTTAGTSSDLKYTIKADTVNSKPAWLVETLMASASGDVRVKMWLDQLTFKCVLMTNSITLNGQSIETNAQCPADGPNSGTATRTSTPELSYINSESVTVPAGTFNAQKYGLEGVTYWYVSTVPVPVRIEYSGGTTVMQLVSYS